MCCKQFNINNGFFSNKTVKNQKVIAIELFTLLK